MKWAFKDLSILSYVLCALWISLVICSVITSVTFAYAVKNCMLVFALCFISELVLNSIAVVRLNKQLEMFHNCRVREYIAELEKFLSRKLRKNAKAYFLLNYAAAKIDLGEYTEALDILRNTELSKKKRFAQWRLTKYHNMACALSFIGNYDEADSYAFLAKNEISDMRKRLREKASGTLTMLDCKLNINKGIFDNAEEYLTNMKWETKKQQINCMYLLARIYQHNGNYEKAKEYYGFCADMGGDLKIAEYAKNQLSRM